MVHKFVDHNFVYHGLWSVREVGEFMKGAIGVEFSG